ncbi:MAG: hypothetical protein OEZ14_16870 [Acidimicrobiia bacterium]|nr:hypothetical protein [Acidimicrobiia bacterium]MDH5522196.1 hypothetical protein [Acidimicrobiia bacterium]
MADELVYVSWGGTGRGATLRTAMERASAAGKGLLYLAILDDASFADLDATFLAVVKDELEWLLDAQLEVTKAQLGIEELPVRVLIRGGDVAEQVAEVVTTMGETEVIVGAPVPLADHESIESLLEMIRGRVTVPVDLITADAEGLDPT